MQSYNVCIHGTRPLLQHSPSSIGESTGRGKKDYIPEEEAEKALYRRADGTIVQPMLHILKAMANAGGDFKYKGRKAYKPYILSGIDIQPMEIPLVHPTNGHTPDYQLDMRPVTVQRARIMRTRPRFDEWALEFSLNILDSTLSPVIIKEILEAAGQYQGIGDYRPLFGQFKVVKFESIEQD